MKKSLSLLLVTMALPAALCACNATMDDYDILPDTRNTTIMDRQDSAAGYNDRMQYPGTNGYNNTNGADRNATMRRYGNTNATANATLHGTYNAPTGMRGMERSAWDVTENELDDPHADDVRYELMLDNAAVHDSDGFLFDGENPKHDTF
jgi:hypothetical protein